MAHGAPGMLQSWLLLALEFPAGSKGEAGPPTLLKWPFSAGKRATAEVTARKTGEGKAGDSSAHRELNPAPWNCCPWQEPPED